MRVGRIACTSVILLLVVLSVSARADLVGLWRFEQGSGLEANDTSGYNNHGYFYGIDGNVPKWIPSTQGGGQYALEFGTPNSGIPTPGSDTNWNYVYVSKSDSLSQLGTKWTIACWYKQYTNDVSIRYQGLGGGYQRIISCPSYEIELGVPTWLYDYFWPYNAGVWQFAIGSSQPLNQWHHMALTYDGVNFRRYIDAAEVFSRPVANAALPYWDPAIYLRFGAQSDPIKDFFVGALDDVAIWNECLDVNQIAKVKDGNFAGPWKKITYEIDLGGGFLWDYTFIAQHNEIVLNFGEKRVGDANNIANIPSWNWQVNGDLNTPNCYGLVNDGLWDGNSTTVEYAAYTTVGDIIVQPKDGDYGLRWKMHKDTKYNLKTRFGGENAVNNVVGVRIYAVDSNAPHNKRLLADLNRTITVNNTWYDVNTTFTADASYEANEFMAECYINQAGGNPRGTAFGHFDYVRIDANEFFNCQALRAYGTTIPYDFDGDCHVMFDDLVTFARDWKMSNDPEPNVSSTELLANSDFYADKYRVPNNFNSSGGPPAGWSFSPATTDESKAGVWNLDRDGLVGVGTGDYQPAGGSVAVYVDTDVNLVQTVASPAIVAGQTYYLYAMVAGYEAPGDGFYATRVIWEYVNDVNAATGTAITPDEPNFVVPSNIVWRKLTTKWTAPAGAAGKYFRVRGKYGDVVGSGTLGYGLFGKVSISTTKPADWPRQNLLTNGDFEDLSNLSMGTPGDLMGWANLYTEGGWTDFAQYWNGSEYAVPYPPGWTFYSDGWSEPGYFGYGDAGLQCMLWAPPPQPVKGRVSLWLGDTSGYSSVMEQKVTPAIEGGQTYYLDFAGAIGAEVYNNGTLAWPVPDPCVVVDVYWLAPGQNDIHSGTQGINWGMMVSLKKTVDHSIGGQGGHWQMAKTSFVADPSLDGYSFFVRAYGEPKGPGVAFEEINLSKEAPPVIGAYTCYELHDKFGEFLAMDLNHDCTVDFWDLDLFANQWLNCNDPAGCL
jgi:hypothetical protein